MQAFDFPKQIETSAKIAVDLDKVRQPRYGRFLAQ